MNKLVVWLAGARAGELTLKSNGNLQFRYEPEYDGPVVSQALPRQAEAHPHAPTRAVFGGLLPEEAVRETLSKNLGISPGNDYRLLEAVGGDVAGAITLLHEGEEPPTEPARNLLDEAALARLLDELPQRPLATGTDQGVRLSLAGAQPKVPVIVGDDGVMAIPTNSAAPTTHILKPEPDRFPGLVDNEAFCMALARACDLQVADVRKATTANGRAYLVVERYDRDLTTDPIRRLHQEDFCQALGVPSDTKYQQEGGPTLVGCVNLVRDVSGVPAQELPKLIGATAFNWIIGNCDAHGKNFSLLYDRGAPTIAPLYDLLSTAVHEELTERLAMSIDGALTLGDVTTDAWMTLADAAELRPAFVVRTVDELLERAKRESDTLVATPDHDNDAARMIAARISRLLAERR